MASKSTISIGFKQEDAEGGFKKLTLDADALRQVMNANVTEAEKLGFRREEAGNANAEYKDILHQPRLRAKRTMTSQEPLIGFSKILL